MLILCSLLTSRAGPSLLPVLGHPLPLLHQLCTGRIHTVHKSLYMATPSLPQESQLHAYAGKSRAFGLRTELL